MQKKNIGGISSVAFHIIQVLTGEVEFRILELGREQRGHRAARRLISLTKIARAIFTVLVSKFDILHSNTPLNPKGVIRDLAVITMARIRGKAVL